MATRIKRLRIAKKQECIVYEADAEQQFMGIEKGSRLFCGFCGEIIGETQQKFVFPFAHTSLIQNLSDRNCQVVPVSIQMKGYENKDGECLQCIGCGGKMFIPTIGHFFGFPILKKPTWLFVPTEIFIEEQKPHIELQKLVIEASKREFPGEAGEFDL